MRIGVISDIHGNAVALEAALHALGRLQVDQLICLGDLATIGPQPLEVLQRLQALEYECTCLMGNHDMALLDLEQAAAMHIAPLLMPSLEWCAAQLTAVQRSWLASLSMTATIELDDHTTLRCFHGSPTSLVGSILPTTSTAELDELLAGFSADVMVCGHTHVQMFRRHQLMTLVNPGSVGNVFLNPPSSSIPTLLPWVEFAILEWRDQQLSVDLRRIPLDIDQFRQATKASDIPIKAWWLQQF